MPDAWFVPRNVLEWRVDPACAQPIPDAAVHRPLVLMSAQGFIEPRGGDGGGEGDPPGDRRAPRIRGEGRGRAPGPRAGAGWLPARTGRSLGRVVEERGPAGARWFERSPRRSLEMIDRGCRASEAVLDVGGGASPLAGALLVRGFAEVTVLDFSEAARGPRARSSARRAHGSSGSAPMSSTGRPSGPTGSGTTERPSISSSRSRRGIATSRPHGRRSAPEVMP